MTTRISAVQVEGFGGDALADERLGRLAEWGRRFDQLGISPGASGNLSVRSARGFLISRTEVELPQIGPGDWVEVLGINHQDDGNLVVTYAGEHIPSRDAFVHGTVYSRVPEAEAVFHLHDQEVLGAADRLEIPSTDEFFPAGTSQSVSEIERFLDRHRAVDYFVLVRHGIVAWAPDLDAAGTLVVDWHMRAVDNHV